MVVIDYATNNKFVIGLKLARINVFMICRKIGKLKNVPSKQYINSLNIIMTR